MKHNVEYLLVEWPDSQYFIGQSGCYHCQSNEEEGLEQAMFVPKNLYHKTFKKTVESLKEEIYANPKPEQWREGQFVFNMIDHLYGIARHIQFVEKVDCFYNDSKIDDFLEKSAKIINEYYENCNTRTSN
jgi:hypothetical protein